MLINKPPVDPEKHTLAGRTSPLSPYKGVPPPPPPPPRVACLSVKRDFFFLYGFYILFVLSAFRSESPSQVFLLAIHYLRRRLKDVPEDKWEEFILSYDNMCNACRMLCARQPLPLNPPFDKIWLKVTKVIDRLHLRNHKNKECHQLFSPEPFKEKNPHLNTPVAEQVFTWAARFKKILCAMPQERFLFYYHRMVVRRNRYTSRCHRE